MSAPPNRGFVIEEFSPMVRNTLRGFARVRTPSGMVLHDTAIHQKDGKAWASPASRPMIGRDGTVARDVAGKVQYAPVVTFASRETRDRFSEQVIAALRVAQPQVFADETPREP